MFPAHNAVLSGDTLTTLTLNREWRKIISSAIEGYFNPAWDDLTLDNQDLLSALLEDLYTAETLGGAMKTTTKAIVLTSDKSTGSLTYVDVPESSFPHTFEFENAEIEVMALLANSSNANAFMRPMANGLAGIDGTEARLRQLTHPVKVADRWEGLPVGVPVTIKSQFKVSNATGTIFMNYNLIYVIREYP